MKRKKLIFQYHESAEFGEFLANMDKPKTPVVQPDDVDFLSEVENLLSSGKISNVVASDLLTPSPSAAGQAPGGADEEGSDGVSLIESSGSVSPNDHTSGEPADTGAPAASAAILVEDSLMQDNSFTEATLPETFPVDMFPVVEEVSDQGTDSLLLTDTGAPSGDSTPPAGQAAIASVTIGSAPTLPAPVKPFVSPAKTSVRWALPGKISGLDTGTPGSLSELTEFLLTLSSGSKSEYKPGQIQIRLSPEISEVLRIIPTYLLSRLADKAGSNNSAGDFSFNDLANHLMSQFLSIHFAQLKEMNDSLISSQNKLTEVHAGKGRSI